MIIVIEYAFTRIVWVVERLHFYKAKDKRIRLITIYPATNQKQNYIKRYTIE